MSCRLSELPELTAQLLSVANILLAKECRESLSLFSRYSKILSII
jgi:hypothetical protein